MNLNKYGLKLIVKVLSYINKRQELSNSVIFSREIESYFAIKKSFVSSLLSCLEHDGLISRNQVGKKKEIVITDAGKAVIKECLWHLLSKEQFEGLRKMV
ncbi:MAG: hypothetical protein ACFFD7_10690 [Candidatus Thorarchaeota archaeon]